MALPVRRSYVGGAFPCTLTSAITGASTSISLTGDTAAWNDTANGPFYIVVDPGLASEEKILVGARSTSTLSSLTRGVDGTSAQSHSAGATVYPIFTAIDADEANKLASTMTTKGDLLSTDGNAPTRLAVGSNGKVLQADSTTTTGLAWNYPPALRWRSGQHYKGWYRTYGGGTKTLNRTIYTPIYVPNAVTVDRIGISAVVNGATDTVRLGIYNDTDGLPSTVLLDAGTASVTGSGAALSNVEITISQALAVGWYWLAANVQASSGTNHDYLGGTNLMFPQLPTVRFASITDNGGYYQDSVTGAFATATSLTITTTVNPTAWVRTA